MISTLDVKKVRQLLRLSKRAQKSVIVNVLGLGALEHLLRVGVIDARLTII